MIYSKYLSFHTGVSSEIPKIKEVGPGCLMRDEVRASQKRNASRMILQHGKKKKIEITKFNCGDTVSVAVPKIDRGLLLTLLLN